MKRKVSLFGNIITYEITEPVSYDHSRGCYYTWAKTLEGERLITSSSKNGIFKITPEFVLQPPADVRGQQS